MLCERCKQREATIHLSQTHQGQTVEQHLCDVCAKEIGLEPNLESVFDNFFGQSMFGQSIFNTTGGIPAFGQSVPRNVVCPTCGLTFDEFRSSGLLGCSHCYEAFADRLEPVFRRVQGGTRHVGHKLQESPDLQEKQKRLSQIADLRKALAKAVKDEQYEQAAQLRDEIRNIEKPIEGGAET
ncbi:MAG: UvrB/UvrC motif-containing protein [Eubacteriales bacterium]|nr:UvrB/UvrC motif-containing protein [Eubacteriales bacterium]